MNNTPDALNSAGFTECHRAFAKEIDVCYLYYDEDEATYGAIYDSDCILKNTVFFEADSPRQAEDIARDLYKTANKKR